MVFGNDDFFSLSSSMRGFITSLKLSSVDGGRLLTSKKILDLQIYIGSEMNFHFIRYL